MGYQPSSVPDSKMMEPILSKEQLLSYFQESFKSPSETLIGMEVEMHGIHTDTLKPITYLEKNGMGSIMKRLVKDQGWKVEKKEGKYIIAISRGGSQFGLESSEAMGELASRVHWSIHGLARELSVQLHELREISKMYNVSWLGLGYQPFSPLEDIRDVDIRRYMINTENPVKDKGRHDDYTWRNIASVQANIDYSSEEDMRRKFQTLLRLAPFLSAMYGNAPLKDGKDTKFVSYRTHMYRDLYPWRSGIRKEFFKKDFNIESWVDFCLKVPMVALFREGKWIPVKNLNFEEFMKSGYEGHKPILEDWIIHISYIYTDTRIKNYIELRVCDSLPPMLIPSVQAIVKAFAYHEDGERSILELTKEWSFDDFNNSFEAIAENGLNTKIKGRKMLKLCKEVIECACEFLHDFEVKNHEGKDESIYLKEIKYFIEVEEKSPGEWLKEMWNGPWKQNPEKLINWSSTNDLFYGLAQ